MSGITTKQKAYMYVDGASIDANYGPWSSTEAYETFLSNTVGIDEPADATTIAVKDGTTGVITKYIYENGQWRQDVPTVTPVDLTSIESRLDALEADKNAALANQITGSITVTPARFYKGVSTTVSATGTITLPTGITTDKISAISLTDGTHTDSGANKTSVSLSNISAQNSSISFTLSGTIAAPYTKSISEPATCTACDPVYVFVMDANDMSEIQSEEDLLNPSNLFYSNNLPITSIKGKSKSITFKEASYLYVLCHESGITAKGASQLAPYPWAGSSTRMINGISYNVYVTQPQQAHTDVVTFN